MTDFTVTINTLYVVLFGTAVMSVAALLAGMRRKRALAWLFGSIGTLQVWSGGLARGPLFDMASATLLVPLALIGFAQALRQVYRQPKSYWRWRSAAFGLLAAAFAVLHVRLGRRQRAEAALAKALRLDPAFGRPGRGDLPSVVAERRACRRRAW